MVWSGGGLGGKAELQSHGVNFSFRKTVREVKFKAHSIWDNGKCHEGRHKNTSIFHLFLRGS